MTIKEQAEMIKKLREKSGLGMMTCKKVLIKNNWDFNKSLEYCKNHQELYDFRLKLYK